jgi:hypothetical protein
MAYDIHTHNAIYTYFTLLPTGTNAQHKQAPHTPQPIIPTPPHPRTNAQHKQAPHTGPDAHVHEFHTRARVPGAFPDFKQLAEIGDNLLSQVGEWAGEWVWMNEEGGENGVEDRKENAKHYNMSQHVALFVTTFFLFYRTPVRYTTLSSPLIYSYPPHACTYHGDHIHLLRVRSRHGIKVTRLDNDTSHRRTGLGEQK